MKVHSSRRYKGPAPTKPETIELALCDLIKVTETWLRRHEESWFDRSEVPAMEPGFNEWGSRDAVPDLCDYAIGALADLREFATEAESKLKQLKKRARTAPNKKRSVRSTKKKRPRSS